MPCKQPAGTGGVAAGARPADMAVTRENAMSVSDTITQKLTAAFAPVSLEVIDESHHHQGHGGWREGGETHFRVKLVSAAFAGKSRVDRHRMVNQTLDAELKGRVHALAMETKAPGE